MFAFSAVHAQGELGIVGAEMSAYLNYWMSQGYAPYQLDYGTKTGIIIDYIQYAGGAHYAGLAQYDVIVSVNGRKINKYADLKSALAQKKAGNTVSVVYFRNKMRYTTTVTLGYPASRNDYFLDWYGNYYSYDQVHANGYNQNSYSYQPPVKDDEKKKVKQNDEKPVQPDMPDNSKEQEAKSDVDVKIPKGKTRKDVDTYCVIIANEKYKKVPAVDFAENDGMIFKEYCVKTLGIPENHIRTYFNATFGEFAEALDFLTKRSEVTNGNVKLIFYYAGHGLPYEKDNSAYIIPSDGYPKVINTCYKLSDLYSQLGQLKSQGTIVLLDACFSGAKRGDGNAIVASRGVAIKPKKESLTGNMVVFSAASNDEMAHSYKSKGHGMFTYFLLKKLQESKGNSTLKEIFDYVSDKVKRSSLDENDKPQTPAVTASEAMRGKWESMKF